MIPSNCEKCGKELTDEVWPFCPHPVMGTQSVMITQDEIPGGIILENYGPEPVCFYSHTERRAWMRTHGLQEKEKFSPAPGSDIDPAGIPNPKGYMDPYTMESARILLERAGQKHIPFDGVSSGVIRNLGVSTEMLTPEKEKDYGL